MRQTQTEKVQQNTANNSPFKAFIGLKSSLGLLFRLNNTAICWKKVRGAYIPILKLIKTLKIGRC